ncbi:MAG: HAMP domain-containing protein, partial [Nitrospirae bacterium]|nr:HAMP domain-containing protein [Nitrospirota bacterium]
EDTLHYRQWVRHLLEIKESMGVRDIFVFDKDHRVLLDVDGEIAIGREYRLLAIDSVEIQKIWTGEPSASTLYRGSDGHYYKSGYAPLFGPNNTVAAGIGVEAGAGFLSLLRALREQMFFIALIGILVTVTLSLLFSRSLISPIRRLVGVMGRVSESGTFETLPLERKDEIGYLGERFNEMVVTLAEKDQTMRTLYAAEKERAEIIHRISAGLAHEIRNPLGALTGYVELLERRLAALTGGPGFAPDENVPRLLEGMQEEVRILNKILTDFLTFAREPRLQTEKVTLPPLLQRVVDAAVPSGSGSAIRVDYCVEDGLPEIQADPLALRKAFLNILLNAAQAMPKGGRMEIEARSSPSPTDGSEGVEVTFSDTGVGIPPDDQDRIFHPFFTTKDEGTGLGLAISRKIVEEHGGTITLSSRVGLGTTFRVWLPVLSRVPEII